MKKVFKAEGNFEAYYKAEKFLRDNGYSYGSSQGSAPVAIWKGDCHISKWRGLSEKERSECHGIITGQMRNGDITVNIKDEVWDSTDKHIEKHYCKTCTYELRTWKTEDSRFIGVCTNDGCPKQGAEVDLLDYPTVEKALEKV
jgi:hypothetical protein